NDGKRTDRHCLIGVVLELVECGLERCVALLNPLSRLLQTIGVEQKYTRRRRDGEGIDNQRTNKKRGTPCHPERYSAKDLGSKESVPFGPRSFAGTLRMTDRALQAGRSRIHLVALSMFAVFSSLKPGQS